jgi:toxin ParE1/3/4
VKLIVSLEAMADIERLRDFLADKNQDAARRAVVALTGAIESLTTLPDRGRPSGMPGMRELIVPFGSSSYILRYAHDPEAHELIVVRVWHGREERE